MRATRVVVHAALLTVPLAVLGRLDALVRPQAVACVVAMVLLAEMEAGSRNAPDPSRAGAPGTALALASALGLLGTAWAAIGFPSFASPTWSWLGLPLVLLGTAMRVAAFRALGASFTSEIVAAPGHALVRTGIYAHLRHPSDLGLLLVAAGLTCLGTSTSAALLTLAVIAPSVALRILREERALALRHPTEHASYRRNVGLTGWHPRPTPAPIRPSK